jgi:DHA2 family multidrug resistance protein-like MFS transporter
MPDPSAVSSPAPSPAPARRWWAMIAIAVSVVVVGLDLTVLSLALPTIAGDMHASTGDLQWISDSYSLVLAAVMLPAGMLGDRYGRKKILIIALLIFLASSAACAYSASVGELITARAFLGIGAAAIFPLALSVLPVLFSKEELPKAIAVMASANMISFPIGPIVGGYLLDHFWWGSVFLINVPVVLIALLAVVFLLPESRSSRKPSIDFPGLVVSSAGLAALTYGFIRAGQDGWGNAIAIATMVGGAAALALFVWLERSVMSVGGRHPLVDLGLFKAAGFRWGTILTAGVSFAMFGLLFAMPQYFQEVRGADALGSGIRLLPLVGGMLVGMIGGTRLATPRKDHSGAMIPAILGARAIVAVGFAVMAAAMAMGAFTRLASSIGYAEAWVAIAGLGLGLSMPSAMNAALSQLSAERSGSGSALLSALRQVGATIGVAILGTLISNAYTAGVPGSGLPSAVAALARSSVTGGVEAAHALRSAALLDAVRTAFVHGMDIMLWACGGIALASALLALAFLPGRSAAAGASARPDTPADPAVVAGVADVATSGQEGAQSQL